MSEETLLPLVTRGRRRAALEALGLNPDATIIVSLSADWITVTTAATPPVVTDGVLQTRTLSGPLADEPVEEVGP